MIISLVLGAVVGFALFTADTLSMQQDIQARSELYTQSEGSSYVFGSLWTGRLLTFEK